DLSVVRHIADRVGVMNLGKLVEMTTTDMLFDDHKHPYTQALLASIPRPNPLEKRERIELTGEVPSPIDPPSGCAIHTRCPFAMDVCKSVEPEFREIEDGRKVACHLY